MKRVKNWESKLEETLDWAQLRTFDWGRWDCCLFAADCVLAITGVDIAADFRGKYSSEQSAYELIGLPESRTLSDFVAQQMPRYDAPEVMPNFAQRGDLVLVTNN